ncbi:hypothetical protein F4782DRAFT_501773 [Xylaria castorea]|nr:hypothetical protein F4782DRAFT_501773 [Xylaria castorea]
MKIYRGVFYCSRMSTYVPPSPAILAIPVQLAYLAYFLLCGRCFCPFRYLLVVSSLVGYYAGYGWVAWCRRGRGRHGLVYTRSDSASFED